MNENNYTNYNREGRGPEYHEYPSDPSRTLETASQILGILSIGSCFVMPVFLPFVLASIAIVLAILSRGKLEKFHPIARRGLTFATVGIVINIAITATVGVTAYKMLTEAPMREQANELMDRMYGYSMDDLLRQLDSLYGTNLADMAEE